MVIIYFFISVGIECVQYIESVFISTVGRFFETNDIFLNTIGGAIGYILYDKHIRGML
ncbi:MAG: VanZ family protein [Clostridium chrysemydis]|uniref:VanZ family protein n=1 Tax=Clostridium chrysemydis TaxID=2665504 RepID=UPI003F314DEC